MARAAASRSLASPHRCVASQNAVANISTAHAASSDKAETARGGSCDPRKLAGDGRRRNQSTVSSTLPSSRILGGTERMAVPPSLARVTNPQRGENQRGAGVDGARWHPHHEAGQLLILQWC